MVFGIENSINVRCDTLYPSMRLFRRWLGVERLNLRFTQRIATAMYFAPARRPNGRPCACPRTAGELRAGQIPLPPPGIGGALCG